MLAILAIVLMVVRPPLPAAADEPDTGSPSASQDAADGVTMRIDALTPVVTASSGLHVALTVRNGGAETVHGASVTLRTNPSYGFVSRTDVQQWADGADVAPLEDALLTIPVKDIAPGASVSVTGELTAGSPALAALGSWGPRPLAITLERDGAPLTVLHTFLTRSQDGLHGERTPALAMTVAMPVTTDGWKTDDAAVDALLSTTRADTDPRAVTGLSDARRDELRAKDRLGAAYDGLQLVTDPLVLDAIGAPHVDALMQPGRFDMTTYARLADPDAYENAGVPLQSWRADTATNLLRATLGDDDARRRAVAWQGSGTWTMDALTTARAQGYGTVVATHDFALTDDGTAHTEVYRVPTDAGDVTVLVAQSTLSTLAQQHATSSAATAEESDAGRIQRFIAQSAFYQMEQPYARRALFVAMCASVDADAADALMRALTQASWIDLTGLDTLANVEPTVDPDEAAELIAALVPADGSSTQSVERALAALARSRDDVERFDSSILLADGAHASPAPSPSSADPASPSASPSAGAGARLTAGAWGRYLLQAHDAFALPALGDASTPRTTMTKGAQDFASALFARIRLVPSGSLTVLSETASMPVTVSNGLPYAIGVRVSSITDSMEIVTSRLADVEVGPRSETQTSFVVRVSTTGTTVANEQLLDRDGQAFGAPQRTTITSSLQISDKSGIAIIALAVVLGLLGLWRQFHRKKDPDE